LALAVKIPSAKIILLIAWPGITVIKIKIEFYVLSIILYTTSGT